MQTADVERIRQIHAHLTEASTTLAGIAGELADHAIPVAVESTDPSFDVPTALARGAPLRVPDDDVPTALMLGDGAAPVARAAPLAADALRAMTPAMAD